MRNALFPFMAAGALLAAASAHGAIVHFENPAGAGHFDWVAPPTGGESLGAGLNIMMPAASQTGARDGQDATFYQRNLYNAEIQVVGQPSQGGGSRSEVAFTPEIPGPPTIPALTAVYEPGDVIGETGWWLWEQAPNIRDHTTGLPFEAGVPGFLGVRFDLGDGWRYGYIGVLRTSDLEFEAFAWGYETEVGVPVRIIPAPGAASLLGLCGLAAARRRRRRHA